MTISQSLRTVLAAGALALVAYPAGAQDLASAEGLFAEGRAAMERGDFAEASTKLAASQRLDPSSGTLLNLAVCHAKLGKSATAWAEFLAAARLAQTQGNTARAEEARKQAAEIQPRVSYVVVSMATRPQGLVVRRDEVELDASTLGSKLPTDPGKHVLEASAPGFESVRVEAVVPEGGAVAAVTIPDLKPAPAKAPEASAAPKPGEPAKSAPTKPAEPPPSEPNRVPAYVVGGVGAAALVTGGAFGFLALSAYKDAKDKCPTYQGCDAAAMSARDKAGTRATIANVGLGVGVVGLGVATALWLTAGSTPEGAGEKAHARFVPVVEPGQAGVAAMGVF